MYLELPSLSVCIVVPVDRLITRFLIEHKRAHSAEGCIRAGGRFLHKEGKNLFVDVAITFKLCYEWRSVSRIIRGDTKNTTVWSRQIDVFYTCNFKEGKALQQAGRGLLRSLQTDLVGSCPTLELTFSELDAVSDYITLWLWCWCVAVVPICSRWAHLIWALLWYDYSPIRLSIIDEIHLLRIWTKLEQTGVISIFDILQLNIELRAF